MTDCIRFGSTFEYPATSQLHEPKNTHRTRKGLDNQIELTQVKKNATWHWSEHTCQGPWTVSIKKCPRLFSNHFYHVNYFLATKRYELLSSLNFGPVTDGQTDRQTDAKWCMWAHRAYAQVCSTMFHFSCVISANSPSTGSLSLAENVYLSWYCVPLMESIPEIYSCC